MGGTYVKIFYLSLLADRFLVGLMPDIFLLFKFPLDWLFALEGREL